MTNETPYANLVLTHLPSSRVLFSHRGRWLYPLLALGHYLRQSSYHVAHLHLYDTVVGRAAALLIAHYRISRLSTMLLSRRAIPILAQYRIAYHATTQVKQLNCKTEAMLRNEDQTMPAFKKICHLAEENSGIVGTSGTTE